MLKELHQNSKFQNIQDRNEDELPIGTHHAKYDILSICKKKYAHIPGVLYRRTEVCRNPQACVEYAVAAALSWPAAPNETEL